MGYLRDICDCAINDMACLSRDKRSIKIIFYAIGAFSLISLIVVMFSMEYTGSNRPNAILGNVNFTYSFAGDPTYVHIYSDWQDFGIRGINNTLSRLTVYGQSEIELYPLDNDFNPPARAVRKENGRYVIKTAPNEVANVDILVTREDEFDYNMHFTYNKKDDQQKAFINNTETEIKILKRGKSDQYMIKTDVNNQVPKAFWIKDDARYDFPIEICIVDIAAESSNCGLSYNSTIRYGGHVKISTTNPLTIQIPVSEISHMAKAPLSHVWLENSAGNLDVRHNKYECTHADDINITSTYNSTNVKMMSDMIMVWGNAKSLEFRQREFQRPWSVILKEGNFAIIIGLLSSFFTLFVGKLFTQLKK